MYAALLLVPVLFGMEWDLIAPPPKAPQVSSRELPLPPHAQASAEDRQVFEQPVVPAASPQPADYTLTEWGAAWCGPCQILQPIVRKLKAEGYHVEFGDLDKDQAVAKTWSITTVPVLVLHDHGVEIGRITGLTDEATIRKWLTDKRVAKRKTATVKSPSDQTFAEPPAYTQPGADFDPTTPIVNGAIIPMQAQYGSRCRNGRCPQR